MDSSVTPKAIGLLDHTILSIIIALQFLGCLGFIASLLLFSRYPGADFNVLPEILFFGAGIVTTVILQKNQEKEFWRRLPALLWNVLFAGYAIFARGSNLKSSSWDTIIFFNVCAGLYLGATSAIGFAAARTAPRQEE